MTTPNTPVPVQDCARLFEGPALNAGLQPVEPALPISLDGDRLKLRRNPPKTGEHDAEIARELGYSDADISALRQKGVLV